MKIHHFGFGVEKIEKAINFFTEFLGFEKEDEIVEDKENIVKICFLKNKETGILLELLEPLNEKSPVYGKKGLLHICFETKNIDDSIKLLRENGFILITMQKVAIAIRNQRIAFLYSKDYGVIEILEKI